MEKYASKEIPQLVDNKGSVSLQTNDLLVEFVSYCDRKEGVVCREGQSLTSSLKFYLKIQRNLFNVPTPVGHVRRLPKVVELTKKWTTIWSDRVRVESDSNIKIFDAQ